MTASVTLTHPTINGGSPIKVSCQSVRQSFKKTNSKKPNANPTDIVKVQTTSIENPKYVIGGIKLGVTGYMTYAQLLSIIKLLPDDTNYLTLSVTYGDGSQLTAYDGVTTDIPVVLDNNMDIVISVIDSRDGYLPSNLTMTLVETKT